MKNFGVYTYKDNLFLGDFLNVETTQGEVKIWFLTSDGYVCWRFREDVCLKDLNSLMKIYVDKNEGEGINWNV